MGPLFSGGSNSIVILKRPESWFGNSKASMSEPKNPESLVNIPSSSRRNAEPDAIAPDGSEIRLLVDERHLAKGASMVEVVLPAGQVSRPVYHQTVEELWYVLEGVGQVWRCPPGQADSSEESAQSVSPGDALVIPTGWRFQFSADESGALRFLCVTLPPWPGGDEALPAEFGGLSTPTV